MGIHPIQGGQGSCPPPPRESKEEREKIFEMQWEIDLLSSYTAASSKDSSITHQLESIGNDLKSGESPEKLLPQLNQIIGDINQNMPKPFALPRFDLVSEGGSKEALREDIHSLETYLTMLSETKNENLPQGHIESCLRQAHILMNQIGTLSTGEILQKLNKILTEAKSIT